MAKALKGRGADVGVTMVARAVNSVGLGMIGGGSLEEALDELESGAADAVIVLENDLHRHASAARVDAALAKAPLVMVVDHQRTAIMDKAHLVLSAASFAESDGTVVNNEGRAQRFFQSLRSGLLRRENRNAGKLALAAFAAQHRQQPSG